MPGWSGSDSYELQMFVWFFMIVFIFKLQRFLDEFAAVRESVRMRVHFSYASGTKGTDAKNWKA